jgi:hypothetical protein
VSVLLGNGDGTFQSTGSYAVGFDPTALVAGDFTGDGRTDLAVAGLDFSTYQGEVSVLLGNGTFRQSVSFKAGYYSRPSFERHPRPRGRLHQPDRWI